MSRVPPFSSPLLVGFETIEKSLERIAKNSDGYPPYNIERLVREGAEVLRITLAVAGFARRVIDHMGDHQVPVLHRSEHRFSPL